MIILSFQLLLRTTPQARKTRKIEVFLCGFILCVCNNKHNYQFEYGYKNSKDLLGTSRCNWSQFVDVSNFLLHKLYFFICARLELFSYFLQSDWLHKRAAFHDILVRKPKELFYETNQGVKRTDFKTIKLKSIKKLNPTQQY